MKRRVILDKNIETVSANQFDENKFYLFVGNQYVGFIQDVKYCTGRLRIVLDKQFTVGNSYMSSYDNGYANLEEIVKTFDSAEIYQFDTMLEMLEYAVSVLKSRK